MNRFILVTGAKGQLGSEIHKLASEYTNLSFYFADRQELDISNKSAIEDFCKKHTVDTIINCAAYTAVDKAEEDSENANHINNLATRYIAEVSKDLKISLIHISTDYVFNGRAFKPYEEDAEVDPQGVYGQTKLDGEKSLQEVNPENSIIIRTSWVYSSFGNNFVKTMLRLGNDRSELSVIFDQVGTPTYAKDLAKVILDILPKIENSNVEIYHYSNEGVCSWYDFAKTIFELSNIDCKVNPIETKQYPTPATRPHYSLLNKAKIKNTYSIKIPYWKDSLQECLNVLKENI
ncbi:dTDP-4-dehydrorhamnose reductase [Campylobacterota bacterium]